MGLDAGCPHWHASGSGTEVEPRRNMSIASACAAEAANKKKHEWTVKLEAAYRARDWTMIDALLREMETWYFAE